MIFQLVRQPRDAFKTGSELLDVFGGQMSGTLVFHSTRDLEAIAVALQ